MKLIRQQGNIVLGFVAGVVLGLLISVVVAIMVTNAPIPFINKVQRPTENIKPGADGKLPDPNKPLNPPVPIKATDAAPPAPAPGAVAVIPAPGTAPAPPGTLPAPVLTPPAPVAPAQTAPESSRYMLQAGAFRAYEEADAMRGQLALLGLEARVFPVEQSGVTFYRVRLGPYGQLADLERIRKMLAERKIEAQVIPLR